MSSSTYFEIGRLSTRYRRISSFGRYKSSTSYHFPLTKAAESRQPASIMIVNRSSSNPPKEWQAGTASIQTGLPIVGRAILAHHVARTASPPTNISAVLHSCSNCSTRQLPSLGINKSMSQDNLHQRLAFHRASKFTMAITGYTGSE